MNSLINKIQALMNSEINKQVNKRIQEFKECGDSGNERIFSELCFCILTANFNAKRAIEIQEVIGNGFLTDDDIEGKLRALGHRFPRVRAEYIVEARKHEKYLKEILNSFNNQIELREWIVKNIKGLGYKEASHFLRNIGFMDLAIIDFHIIDILVKNGLISRPNNRSLGKKKYLEIEEILRKIAKNLNLSLAELDLYLWYLETKRILK
ncbi:MAG: N-glycosylase/DNA lyase [Candidatus Helarchaeota archaeon]